MVKNLNSPKPSLSYDIFCDVVDNLGDIGVCWRLSKALVELQRASVRLWCNNLSVAKRIISEIDVSQPSQRIQNIEVREWSQSGLELAFQKSNVLIEAFACEVPEMWWEQGEGAEPYLHINLEYLGLETWTFDVHQMYSIGIKVPKYIFFPGPSHSLGGLTLFENSRQGVQRVDFALKWLKKNDLEIKKKWLFLFSYPRNHKSLFEELGASSEQWIVWLAADQAEVKNESAYDNLTFLKLPYLDQPDFDAFLLACDLLWIRGEESLSRALLGGVPFVWEAYRQELEIRLEKVRGLNDFMTELEVGESWKSMQIELNSKDHWSTENNILSLLKPESLKCFKKCANLLEKNELSENLTKFCLSKIKPEMGL